MMKMKCILDVKIICDVAVDVIRCAKEELGECVAAEVEKNSFEYLLMSLV